MRQRFEDAHAHEFEEPHTIEADETVAVHYRCIHAPILGSTYSERHDEYFYEEGPRCEATKHVYYNLDGVYWGDVKIEYDDAPHTWEEVVMVAERYINETPGWQHREWWGEDTSCSVDVEHEGRTYTVRYEKRSEEVHE